jgi:hypothetical protein
MASLIQRTSTMPVMEPRKAHRLHFFRTCVATMRPCAQLSQLSSGHALGSRTLRNLGGYHACL